MKKVIILATALAVLSGCAMTPEQQQAFIRAMNRTTQQNSQRMMQPQQIPVPTTTQTRCQDNGIGSVNCTSQSY